MIGYFVQRQLNATEKKLGVSVEYLRHIARVSLPDLFRVRRISQLLAKRSAIPPAPFHVARLVATIAEDCGECVQIEVNLAREDGVPKNVLQCVVEMRPSDLPEELGDVYLFAECVVQGSGDAETLRGKMRQRYGERGVVELALAISLARNFPTIKRGLGYATTCNLKAISYDRAPQA